MIGDGLDGCQYCTVGCASFGLFHFFSNFLVHSAMSMYILVLSILRSALCPVVLLAYLHLPRREREC